MEQPPEQPVRDEGWLSETGNTHPPAQTAISGPQGRLARLGVPASAAGVTALVAALTVLVVASLPLVYVALISPRAQANGQSSNPSLVTSTGTNTPIPATLTSLPQQTWTPIANCSQCASSVDITFARSYLGYNGPGEIVIAPDGSGDVRSQQFTISVTSGAPDSYESPQVHNQGVWATCDNSGCYVPQDCASSNITMADNFALLRLRAKFTQALPSGYVNQAQYAVVATFDHSTLVCVPGAGYTSSGIFMYTFSESATYAAYIFKPQDVTDYTAAWMRAHVPAGYYPATVKGCYIDDSFYATFRVSGNKLAVSCSSNSSFAIGEYAWNAAQLQALAQHLAGQDYDRAVRLLNETEGISGLPTPLIKLTGGTQLPTDPSRFVFHVLPSPPHP